MSSAGALQHLLVYLTSSPKSSIAMNLSSKWKKYSPYFEPEELLSEDGMKIFDKGYLVMQPTFLLKLNAFREKLGVPIRVNSGVHRRRGWRSSAENLKPPCTGKPFHPMGLAADCTAKNIDQPTLAAEAKLFGFHGILIYDTFTHIDLRPKFL